MPLNIEQIARFITQATAPRFRGNLVSQGLSRSILWAGGMLPEGSPNYSTSLSANLLDYGFSLLDLGLQLRSLDKNHPLLALAFERAAESIEAVVRRGNPELLERGFFTIAAASAYHLGHFSARAFSLFASNAELNLSPAEQALRNLFIRNLDGLRENIGVWAGEDGFDSALTRSLTSARTEPNSDRALNLLLNTQFHRALACFEFALETGARAAHDNAIVDLETGMRTAGDFNHVTFWWLFTIARHLVDDLWDNSLHVRLPGSPVEPDDSSWASLRKFFVASLLKRSLSEIDLWPSQLKAAERAFDINDDLVVSLPTSAGKTRIAEICILRTLSLSQRIVFVTPLRALSAQTERTLRRTFVPLGFSVSSLYGSSGLTGDDMDSLGNRDIVVTTPEKLDFALRNNPDLLDAVGLIVLDEGHSIGTEEREIRYEVLVQRLLKRTDAGQRRIVCLSALLPSGDELSDFVSWLRQDLPGDPITCEWRATRQRFGHIAWLGNHARLVFRVDSEKPFVPSFIVSQPGKGKRKKGFPKNNKEFTLATAWRFVEQGQTVLIFCPLRKSVEPLAKEAIALHAAGYLTSLLPDNLSTDQRQHLSEAISIGSEWLGAYHPAVLCLNLGVAVHHGSLPRPFQRAVERLLRDQILKITVASPTLAQGLNLSATTLLFHSIHRSGETIPPEEFLNVSGRAGRAFVDVEGQVVCVDFENKLSHAWEALRLAGQKRSMRSGLLRLVVNLALTIRDKANLKAEQIIEYVLNSRNAWDPPAATDDNPKLPQQWDSELARLDAAILALLPHETDVAKTAELIDEVLSGSLWERSLARSRDVTKQVAVGVLRARTTYIWNNSSAMQRKGAFFAGVSFNTGLKLSEHGAELNALLTASDTAFAQHDVEAGTKNCLEFAKIVFTIEPFKPEELPGGWELITAQWITGASLADIAGGIESEVVNFLETVLIYRLVWALEAVRVRAIASGEADKHDFNGYTAMAVETGTSTYAASLLIHCGLASRAAAIKAVEDESGDFGDTSGMRRWIFSQEVKRRTELADWPTPQTATLWKEFVAGLNRQALDKWDEQDFDVPINWSQRPVRAGTPVRIKDGKKIYTMRWEPVGDLRQNINLEGRVVIAHVGRTGLSIVGQSLGPRT